MSTSSQANSLGNVIMNFKIIVDTGIITGNFKQKNLF